MAHKADSVFSISGNGKLLPLADADSITALFDGYKADLVTNGHTVQSAPGSHIHNKRVVGNDTDWSFTIVSNGKLLPETDADAIMKLLAGYVVDLIAKGHSVDLLSAHISFSHVEVI